MSFVSHILIDLPESISSERLVLSPYKAGDGSAYFKLLHENVDHFTPAVEELQRINTEEQAEVFIRQRMHDWIARNRLVLAMWLDDRMIGQIWIEPLDWKLGIFEIGYFVEKASSGKGYVTEAVKRASRFLFDDLNASKLEIHYDANNEKSGNVAIRAGFVKEGQSRKRTKLADGTMVDRMYYGLLKEEFEHN